MHCYILLLLVAIAQASSLLETVMRPDLLQKYPGQTPFEIRYSVLEKWNYERGLFAQNHPSNLYKVINDDPFSLFFRYYFRPNPNVSYAEKRIMVEQGMVANKTELDNLCLRLTIARRYLETHPEVRYQLELSLVGKRGDSVKETRYRHLKGLLGNWRSIALRVSLDDLVDYVTNYGYLGLPKVDSVNRQLAKYANVTAANQTLLAKWLAKGTNRNNCLVLPLYHLVPMAHYVEEQCGHNSQELQLAFMDRWSRDPRVYQTSLIFGRSDSLRDRRFFVDYDLWRIWNDLGDRLNATEYITDYPKFDKMPRDLPPCCYQKPRCGIVCLDVGQSEPDNC